MSPPRRPPAKNDLLSTFYLFIKIATHFGLIFALTLCNSKNGGEVSRFLKPFQLRILVSAIPSTRGNILQLARSQIGPTQVIPGCLKIRMVEDIEAPGTFIWEETWNSKELLEQRVISDKFRSILALLDISSGTPEISISEITNQDGLGWITSVREKQKLNT